MNKEIFQNKIITLNLSTCWHSSDYQFCAGRQESRVASRVADCIAATSKELTHVLNDRYITFDLPIVDAITDT